MSRGSSSRRTGLLLPGRARFVCALLALCACPHRETDLLSQVKQALAEREKKLSAYRFDAEATQGEEKARHSFAFKSPNKMHGVMLEPQQLEWSFDGTRLYQARAEQKKLLVYELKLPQAKADAVLYKTFSPFVFEGFRSPLLPPTGVTAKRVPGPKGEAVELSVELPDRDGAITVRWVLKWPGADFVSKTTVQGPNTGLLIVDEEQCDAALSLCVPKRVSQRANGDPVGSTTLKEIDLHPQLPADDFTLKPREGWSTEPHQIVED